MTRITYGGLICSISIIIMGMVIHSCDGILSFHRQCVRFVKLITASATLRLFQCFLIIQHVRFKVNSMAPYLRSSIGCLRSGRKRLHSVASVSFNSESRKKLKSEIKQSPTHGPVHEYISGEEFLLCQEASKVGRMKDIEVHSFKDTYIQEKTSFEGDSEGIQDFGGLKKADEEEYRGNTHTNASFILSGGDTELNREIDDVVGELRDVIINELGLAIRECKIVTEALARNGFDANPLDSYSDVTDPADCAMTLVVRKDCSEEITSVRRKRGKRKRKLRFTHIKRHYLKYRKMTLILKDVPAPTAMSDHMNNTLRGGENQSKIVADGNRRDSNVKTTIQNDIPVLTNRNERDETINYEVYRFNWDEDMKVADSTPEDEEMEDIFRDLALIQQNGCQKKALPQKNSTSDICKHKRSWDDEVGWFCEICGLVIQDIQSIFIPEMHLPTKRKAPFSRQESEDDDHGNLDTSGVLEGELAHMEGSHRLKLRLHPFHEDVLKEHQKEGFDFLVKNLIGGHISKVKPGGCILAHAPGTGKTLLTISFIQSFLTALPGGRVLIVAPKIMLRIWQREFEHWNAEEIPVYNLNECRGTELATEDMKRSKRNAGYCMKKLKLIRKWLATRSVLIISYNLFASLITSGLKDVNRGSIKEHICQGLLEGPDLMVLDEGHFPRTKRTKISRALMLVRTERKILLSGTLFQNNFKELFNLLKLIRHDVLASVPEFTPRLKTLEEKKSVKIAGKWGGPVLNDAAKESIISSSIRRECEEQIFMEDIGFKLDEFLRGGDDYQEINRVMQKLRSLTSPIIHWYPGKILDDLPGLMEYVIYLNLTSFQEELHSHLQGRKGLEEKIRLTEICIHPALLKTAGSTVATSASPDQVVECADPNKGVKTAFLIYLLRLCSNSGERLLIFCQTLAPLALIRTMLTGVFGWEKDVDFLSLDGTMPSDERQRVIEQFNTEGNTVKAMLASITACKEGISLVGASRVVILDVLWNPSVVRQAVGRAFRIGQKRKVFVYRLVAADTQEETMLQAAVQKDWFSRVLMDQTFDIAEGGYGADKILRIDRHIGDRVLEQMLQEDKFRRINRVRRYNTRLF
ncbi:DNA repair and recombination protein RAD54 and RAD54-like protein [Marchantia polymorpha subsp. ruderalis]|uniref:Uncharacterized protein n=2 Tax=Marchantia polymorpha TaxID=3197 RepID=A0AAF6AM61_MARPO|nr:hypothetical protein MARPO_0043s0033 [Marchantia polymorpha]BBM97531.1 hypothetical protein Mp_1g06410 [Marchantia polymorpha subsp. ruderalis]|eukprot:PTQ39770.1 hypothetical protein MARPO_0043s0033 [Marchantia polymorpha]